MRARYVLLASLLGACTGSSPGPGLAITGATVINVTDGSQLKNAVLVIEGTRITALGPAGQVDIPAGFRVVQGSGKYLIPGLWEMHAHIMTPRETEIFFPLLVAHGVLGIRDAGGDFAVDGWPPSPFGEGMTPSQFRELASHSAYAPRTFACGASIDGPALARFGVSAILDRQAPLGATCIKLMSQIPRTGFLELMAEARKRSLPVAGHVPITVNAGEASDLGIQTIEHLTQIPTAVSSKEAEMRALQLARLNGGVAAIELALWGPPVGPLFSTYDTAKASELFRRFVANHTWMVPTFMIYAARKAALSDDSAFWNDPTLSLVPQAWVDSWRPDRLLWIKGVPAKEMPVVLEQYESWHRVQIELARRMHAAGVEFLAGTDVSNWNQHVPGISLHQELAEFVDAGFSPLEALRTATLNPARYLGITDSVGTIAAGKVADMVMLDADPTVKIANTKRIAAVILAGRLIERAELDRILADARARAASYPKP